MRKPAILLCLLLIFQLHSLFAQVKSQWRGPNRDGHYPNENLLKAWPLDGPPLLWSTEGLGEGYSSAAVTANRIYLTGMIQGEGFLFAFTLDGKRLWKVSYGPEWAGSHPGARTTPTVVGDRIYLMSATGQVVCFSQDGEKIWAFDLIQKYGARNLTWGMTESLLIDGDRLFCTPGGKDVIIAVLNKNSGEVIKTVKGNGETSGYCSPLLIKHGPRRLLITMTERSVIGIDADSVDLLWRHRHETEYNVNANTPIYQKGRLYIFSGYGTGGQMFGLSTDGSRVERIWVDRSLDSQMGGAVLIDGYIYGSGHDRKQWHCLEWETGKIQYSTRALGNKGSIIFSDGMLYAYSERGDVALLKPNPGEFEIVSSFRVQAGSGPHWAHPVIRDGRLYLRHGDVLLIYEISE